MTDNFVHDAEYYVVEVQNKEKWAAEDKDLDADWLHCARSTAHRQTSSTSCLTTSLLATWVSLNWP